MTPALDTPTGYLNRLPRDPSEVQRLAALYDDIITRYSDGPPSRYRADFKAFRLIRAVCHSEDGINP